MMCFRDMTFCVAQCGTEKCERKLTKEVEVAADKWWGQPGAPIAVSDFQGSCPQHTPKRPKDAAPTYT